MLEMLHPNQFRVMEAWVAFNLNEAPIHTEHDGDFNVVALMDAASCFLLSNGFISTGQSEMRNAEALRALEEAWSHKQDFPQQLMVSSGQRMNQLLAEARNLGIKVIEVSEDELQPLIAEARESFREHFAAGRLH
ncbi:hypothetical protein CKO36_17940 [Rhabdochromatium marinum]|nr:hypothetical protein [Rhabdochromatium marinum]